MCKALEDMKREAAEKAMKEACKALEDMKREAAEKAAKEATIKTAKETQEETLLQNLRSLMETLHFSAEQAMSALKVPESRRAQLAAKL